MRRYARLLLVQIRTSTLLAAQYRWEFFTDGLMSLFWAFAAGVPLLAMYPARGGPGGIPDWTFNESLVVIGWFIVLDGFLEGAINPGLQAVVDQIRTGTLDLLLVKPADAQFLVSTARYNPWRIITVLGGLSLIGVAFHRLGRWPTAGGIATSLALFACAVFLLYSLWILIIAAAFYVVKVDNLTYLFSSIFDAGRWPASVFRGGLRFVFTFIIPVAVMTTFPAEALLGRFEITKLPLTILGCVAFGALARRVWQSALGHYTSAGG